ncbi:MAG: SPOR domain-containing protein [Pseudomonadota bacterium]|nr:SPOR domain-containing protein [Pseudomonadota bacterium]
MSVAAKNNYQDYDPRHRLTGAVVLILLAIILLPMLLSKKPDAEVAEADPVVMEITRQGKKVFVSRISSTTEADSRQEKKPADGAETTAEPDKKGTDQQSTALFSPMKTPVARSAEPKKTAVQATTKKKTVPKKSSKIVPAGSWILQVGVFSKSENANKKVSELKKKGFSAKSGKMKTSKGTVTKVWIGPFKDRKSAEKMQDRLQHKTKQRGLVVKNKS